MNTRVKQLSWRTFVCVLCAVAGGIAAAAALVSSPWLIDTAVAVGAAWLVAGAAVVVAVAVALGKTCDMNVHVRCCGGGHYDDYGCEKG